MVFVQQMMDAPTCAATIAQAQAAKDDFVIWDDGAMLPLTKGNYESKPTGFGYTQPRTCLKHTPTDTYVTIGITRLACCWARWDRNVYGLPGIAVIFSSEWDMENHKANGAVYTGIIPYMTSGGSVNANNLSMITNPYQFSTALSVDKFGF